MQFAVESINLHSNIILSILNINSTKRIYKCPREIKIFRRIGDNRRCVTENYEQLPVKIAKLQNSFLVDREKAEFVAFLNNTALKFGAKSLSAIPRTEQVQGIIQELLLF